MSPNKITRIALLVVIAACIQYCESFLYMPVAFPGVKFGFANIITLICIYYFDYSTALFVAIMRVLLGCLIIGTLFSPQFIMSMTGSVIAALVMIILKKFAGNAFSPLGMSVAGAVAHIATQLFTASLLVGSFTMFYYLPVAGNLSIITGILNGVVFVRVRSILDKILL